ncbi:MAG TPA: hypothetical protein VND19_07600 [Acetobacteraceae bacterium]|nr:hypothetical protein [Acetobacteraceae bacterium]
MPLHANIVVENADSVARSIQRQRERTIDNLKRLYAVTLSVSFATAVGELVATLHDEHWDYRKPVDGSGIGVRITLLVVLLTTAAIFFFQSDRFLDIKYGMPRPDRRDDAAATDELPYWGPIGLSIDALTVIVTVLPFPLMAYALEPHLMQRGGPVPFFLSYLLLLYLAVIPIFLGWAVGVWNRVCNGIGSFHGLRPGGRETVLTEEQRSQVLSVHWVLLDSGTALILLGLFWRMAGSGAASLCLPSAHVHIGRFTLLFTIVALLRNFTDGLAVWPFLYLNKWTVSHRDLPWHARWLEQEFAYPFPWKLNESLCVALFIAAMVAGFFALPRFYAVMTACLAS